MNKRIFADVTTFFFGLHLNLSGEVDVRGRNDIYFFFGLHWNLSGILDIRGRAALGFKIFRNFFKCGPIV